MRQDIGIGREAKHQLPRNLEYRDVVNVLQDVLPVLSKGRDQVFGLQGGVQAVDARLLSRQYLLKHHGVENGEPRDLAYRDLLGWAEYGGHVAASPSTSRMPSASALRASTPGMVKAVSENRLTASSMAATASATTSSSVSS